MRRQPVRPAIRRLGPRASKRPSALKPPLPALEMLVMPGCAASGQKTSVKLCREDWTRPERNRVHTVTVVNNATGDESHDHVGVHPACLQLASVATGLG